MPDDRRVTLRRVAPFAAAAGLAFATAPLPPEADWGQLLAAAALLASICLAAVCVPWLRPPHALSVLAPLAYLIVVALMRDAQGGAASGYAPLAILPVLWVALHGPRWHLVPCIAGVAALFVVPLLELSSTDYPTSEWRRAVLWTTVSAIVGFTTQAIVARRARESREHAAQRDFIDAVLESAGALVVVLDGSARVIRFNRAAEEATGVSADEAMGARFWDLGMLSGQDAEAAREMFDELDAMPFPITRESVWTARDGTRRALIWSSAALHDETGRVTNVVGTGIDVTRQRAAEATARMAERQFIAAFDHAPIGMALMDLSGRLMSVNPALCTVTGYAQTELEQMSVEQLTHADDQEAEAQVRASLLAGHVEHRRVEHRMLRSDGQPIDVAVSISLMRDVAGVPSTFVFQVLDVTERKRSELELQRLADHDSLTGLLNRRSFDRELERHVVDVRRYGSSGAVIVLDVDRFKQVNDTLGHHVGDELIVAVAGALRSSLREADILARLGGDEFAVLLPRADHAGAETVAAKLVAAVRQLGDTAGSGITISVGVAPAEAHPRLSADALLVEADRAMYDAKAAGRNRYAMFDAAAVLVTRAR